MHRRLLITVLIAGALAGAALPEAGPAWAEPAPAAPAAPEGSPQAEGGPSPAPTLTSPAPEQPATTTNAPTGVAPQSESSPAPEVERQHTQPSSHVGVGRRGAGKARMHAKARTKKPLSATTGARHTPALAPGSLTPPLPSALAGPLAGVPSFFIDSFAIPPFLLPIYQAAGADYGIPWQVLAAINEVETDYGRDLSVSSAGAEGWMQFMPATWSQYGVDVNSDGFQDPYNPADAIFAAARYLKAADGDSDIKAAIFAYNHSQAYVQSVLLRARLLGGTPPSLLTAVTGLTEARFPVHAPSHFSDGFPAGPAGRQIVGTAIYSQPDAPVVAVQDGIVTQVGRSAALGAHISLKDAYGNAYTYAELGSLSTLYPVLEGHRRFSLHPLRAGVHVLGGTVLGHLGYGAQAHVVFQLRPAGAGAPLIDPKPILDGWVKLQDSSAIHVKGPHPFDAANAIPGQVLLESKVQLEASIARDPHLRLAPCERSLILGGNLDRRVLADLAFLSTTGLRLTVPSASCAPNNESVVLSAVDGSPVAYGARLGGAARLAVGRLLRLQGAMRPLSLAGPGGLPKALGVQSSRLSGGLLRIGFQRSRPAPSSSAHAAGLFVDGLSPVQWIRLIARLGQIPDPEVSAKPSPAAVPDPSATGASAAASPAGVGTSRGGGG